MAALAPVSGLSLPSVVSITRPVYAGVTYTSVNKWDTLPLLQLQGSSLSFKETYISTCILGFDGTHAAWVAGTMFVLYILAAYVYFQYPRLSEITGKPRNLYVNYLMLV